MSGSGESLPEVRLSWSPAGPARSVEAQSELVPVRVNVRFGEGAAEPRTGLIPRAYVEELSRLQAEAEASSGRPCRLEARVRSEPGGGGRLTLTVRACPVSAPAPPARERPAELAELVQEAAKLRPFSADTRDQGTERERSREECTQA